MMIVVTGGSGSGKSEIAESYAVQLHKARHAHLDEGLFYVATMKRNPLDEETERRIGRHLQMRSGKGFRTIECPVCLGRIRPEAGVYLIEDLPNLLANEMWGEDGALRGGAGKTMDPGDAAGCILEPLEALAEAGDVVVVTGNVSSDGLRYESGTEQYVWLLNRIGAALAARSQLVVEAVCGIPVTAKGSGTIPETLKV